MSVFQGWATGERTHPRNWCVREVECRIFDSATWLGTDRPSWRSDASITLDEASHGWVLAGHQRYTRAQLAGEAVGSSRPKQIPQVSRRKQRELKKLGRREKKGNLKKLGGDRGFGRQGRDRKRCEAVGEENGWERY